MPGVPSVAARYPAWNCVTQRAKPCQCSASLHALPVLTCDGCARASCRATTAQVFVKSTWHVGDPYTRRYGTWATQHAEGDAGTDGELNENMYQYAIRCGLEQKSDAPSLSHTLLWAASPISRL